MARHLPLDVVEPILVLLDVKDLIRCKSVCKSWRSLISTPHFVKAHLDLAYANDRNNPELGHRRIYLSGIKDEDRSLYFNLTHIVGSSNGLLCVSPKSVKFLVTNPSTGEHKKLPTPPYGPYNMRRLLMLRVVVCWGFGYDLFTDDYKVIVGFEKREQKVRTMLFHVLTLKSNTWKLIGQVKYDTTCFGGRTGILCGGTLHWFMTDNNMKQVILSLDLSTEEFREVPLPDADVFCDCDYRNLTLGVLEESLCIYSRCNPLSTNKWIMKNNKWELYIDDHCQSNYDVVHYLPTTESGVYICDDGTRVPSNGNYIRASIFVKSLVSPHSYLHVNDNYSYCEGQHKSVKQQGHKDNERVESDKVNLGKRKRNKTMKGSCKHKTPPLKKLVGYKCI